MRPRFRTKRMTIEEGRRAGIGNYPNFDRTGSIIGMKRMFYGMVAKLVICGRYIYNVSDNQRIYDQAH